MHPVLSEPEPVRCNIVPGEEPDAAEYDQQADRQGDADASFKKSQRGKGAGSRPHDVEARIAEGGDRMEQGHPDPCGAEGSAEGRQHDEGAEQFRQEGCPEDEAGHFHDAADLVGRDAVLEHAALQERDPSARKGCDKGRYGDDPQSADLDQDQDDRLPEDRPMDGRIPNHQPRNAHGGGSREQRILQWGPGPLLRGKRQHQQQRSDQDDAQKARYYDLVGGEFFPQQTSAHVRPPVNCFAHYTPPSTKIVLKHRTKKLRRH